MKTRTRPSTSSRRAVQPVALLLEKGRLFPERADAAGEGGRLVPDLVQPDGPVGPRRAWRSASSCRTSFCDRARSWASAPSASRREASRASRISRFWPARASISSWWGRRASSCSATRVRKRSTGRRRARGRGPRSASRRRARSSGGGRSRPRSAASRAHGSSMQGACTSSLQASLPSSRQSAAFFSFSFFSLTWIRRRGPCGAGRPTGRR
ncbi:MAG: hypothetical protein MZV64_10900 [Ignavibacteriales bacterium]|nr:hypothetical protein [Ignavibacteriales bacterium]